MVRVACVVFAIARLCGRATVVVAVVLRGLGPRFLLDATLAGGFSLPVLLAPRETRSGSEELFRPYALPVASCGHMSQ